MQFTRRKSVVLPSGVSAETIRTRINAYFVKQPKVGGAHSYVKEARQPCDVGCIYATLAEHSNGMVESMLAGCHVVVMRDLGLPDFSFVGGLGKIKVLVIGIPLADTGRGSIWWVED